MVRSRSPCKCPDCEYVSTRHWNVKSHIKKKHGGVGEPVRVYGRHELAISEQQSTLSHENSLQNLTNDNLELIEFESFNSNDWREMQLAKKFKAIVPQFSEFHRLLRSRKLSEQVIQATLAKSVIAAITSPNPVSIMSESVNFYKNKSAIKGMLTCICTYTKMNISEVKNALK